MTEPTIRRRAAPLLGTHDGQQRVGGWRANSRVAWRHAAAQHTDEPRRGLRFGAEAVGREAPRAEAAGAQPEQLAHVVAHLAVLPEDEPSGPAHTLRGMSSWRGLSL